jgi:FkbM family methyltransferase
MPDKNTNHKQSILKRITQLYKNRGMKYLIYSIPLHFIHQINFQMDRRDISKLNYTPDQKFVIKDILGSKMYLNIADRGLSKDLILNGIREAQYVETVQKIIKEGDVVIDIGANIGYYVMLESKLVGTKGVIYAIEPVPENYDLLNKNIALNGYSNVKTYRLALGNNNGMEQMYVPPERNLSVMTSVSNFQKGEKSVAEIEVKVMTLDEFLKDKPYPNVIRMDIEGYEYQIVKGMKKVLGTRLPLTILMELHCSNRPFEQSRELLKILKDNGFEITDAVYEGFAKRYPRHKILYKAAHFLQARRAGSVPPLGHQKISIDEMMANASILNDDWYEIEICFQRKAS